MSHMLRQIFIRTTEVIYVTLAETGRPTNETKLVYLTKNSAAIDFGLLLFIENTYIQFYLILLSLGSCAIVAIGESG